MSVGDSVQKPLPEKLPPPVSDVKVTVPVGVVGPLRAVSVTVAVHDVAWPMTTVSGEQVTFVVVRSGWGCSGLEMMFSTGVLAKVTAKSKLPSGVRANPSLESWRYPKLMVFSGLLAPWANMKIWLIVPNVPAATVPSAAMETEFG